MSTDTQTSLPIQRFPKSSLVHLLPLLWLLSLALTEAGGPLHLASVGANLQTTADWIASFQKENNRLPGSLAEIRLYAHSHQQPYTPYDSYGLRLQYLPLRENAYLLKSFSSDAMENTLTSPPDEQILFGLEPATQGLQTLFPNLSQPMIYQGAFLGGLQAASTGLIARLEVNVQLRTRFLLIRDPKDPRFSLISFHDGVEEFLWLPSGTEVVYTAQGSERYEDGIYYWNLKDGTIHNIFPKLKDKIWPNAAPDASFYLSISHISEDPQLLYVLAAQATQKKGLNPKDFYRFSNLYAISLDAEHMQNPNFQQINSEVDYNAFDYPVSHLALIDERHPGDAAQESWRDLELSGEAEKLIDQWQEYSSKQAQSPLLPYSLWWLVSIYNDTFRQLQETGPDEAQVIRNFGIEIADALTAFPTAPLHLRAMAEFLKKNLLLSQVADYNVCSLRPLELPAER